MSRFKIYAREVHIQGYIVEAETVEKAVKQFNEGEGTLNEGDFDYSHTDGIAWVALIDDKNGDETEVLSGEQADDID